MLFRILRGLGFSVKKLPTNYLKNRISSSVFRKSKVVLHPSGQYYLLDPMPTEEQLETYYSNSYWNWRETQNTIVRRRDLVHFSIISEFLRRHSDSSAGIKGAFCNFGSGHGGISNLMRLNQFKIINIEPSIIPSQFKKDVAYYKSINDLAESEHEDIAFFYSSHSLEHVQDIDNFLNSLRKLTNPETLFFFEVPDGDCPSRLKRPETPEIAHTYYFRKQFFENLFSEVYFLATLPSERYTMEYLDSPIISDKAYPPGSGGVIRCLAKGLV